MLEIVNIQSVEQGLNTLDSLVIKLVREGSSFDDAMVEAKYETKMQELLASN